ncbi:MAG TPA: prolipoprotein diacylglyceryl transferase family protein [Polyangia bacterium]|jgi:phosphatidylglycerol:prolipoprotein diacylglycerol transferase
MRPEIVARLELAGAGWLGPLVPNYVVMLALGSLLAAVVVVDEARRLGYARRDSLLVLMIGYAGGLAGAWAVPLTQGLAAFVRAGHFHVPTGMAAYGGLIGGTLAGAVTLKLMGRRVRPFLDATAPAVGVGYFFARIGCFLAGCDYGCPAVLPWAVRFPRGSWAWRDHLAHGYVDVAAPASLPVHPTQLYLALGGLGLYFVLRAVPARGDGRRFAVLVVVYALYRSLIETWRGDANRGSVGPLSTSQLIAALTLVALGVTALVLRRGRVVSSAGAGTDPPDATRGEPE